MEPGQVQVLNEIFDDENIDELVWLMTGFLPVFTHNL
jgi:hypothetical protein